MTRSIVLTCAVFLSGVCTAGEPPRYDPPPPTAQPPADTSEVDQIVRENPGLVHELLVLAAKGDAEEIAPTIFCLGPGVVDSLLSELESDDPEIREAAAGALCYACAHEAAPRSKVIKAILAMKAKAEPDDELDVAELLVFVIRTTRPDFRVILRKMLEHGMSEEFGSSEPDLDDVKPFRTYGGVI